MYYRGWHNVEFLCSPLWPFSGYYGIMLTGDISNQTVVYWFLWTVKSLVDDSIVTNRNKRTWTTIKDSIYSRQYFETSAAYILNINFYLFYFSCFYHSSHDMIWLLTIYNNYMKTSELYGHSSPKGNKVPDRWFCFSPTHWNVLQWIVQLNHQVTLNFYF